MFIFRFRKKSKKPAETHNDHDPRKKRSRRFEQFKNACKKITTFMFSRVGLCFVVVGYVVIGGFIFKSIEGSYEEEKAKNKTLINDVVNVKTDNLVFEIWNMTKFELVFHEKNYTNKLKAKLLDYQKNLTEAVKDGYKGASNHTIIKWTFPGSILYSVTIVTTIGYGHITCETDAGKIATIFYAIIGIPMMLLCLANIGTSMANFFRFLYAKVCCGYCNYVKRKNIRLKAASLTSAAVGHPNAISYAALANTALLNKAVVAAAANIPLVDPNRKSPNLQNNSANKYENDYNNLIEANQSGATPNEPKTEGKVDGEQGQEQTAASSPTTVTTTTEGQENNKKIKIAEPNYDSLKPEKLLQPSIAPLLLKNSPTDPAEILDLFEDSNSMDYRKITVPISITLFILSSYILLGGILFKTLEEWTVLDGVYFCFITLSTIGLGDYVPGNSINDSDTQAELKLVGCSLYLLMGLSLIAMCFNLMQEEVTAKFRKLAVRLGIIDDPNFW
jgi:hypothetical protein